MLKQVQGCLLSLARAGEFDIVVHGCNCFCVMGAGIAKQIQEEYPEAYAADCATFRSSPEKIGTYSFANTGKFIIINAYTQFRTSSFVCDVFEYEGFAKILNTLASEYPSGNFGLPYIGMGLANGNPSRIIPMIEKFANQVTSTGGSVTLVEYKP